MDSYNSGSPAKENYKENLKNLDGSIRSQKNKSCVFATLGSKKINSMMSDSLHKPLGVHFVCTPQGDKWITKINGHQEEGGWYKAEIVVTNRFVKR